MASSADASAPPTSRSNIKGTTRPTAPKMIAVDSKTAVFFRNSLTDAAPFQRPIGDRIALTPASVSLATVLWSLPWVSIQPC
jgi:hypothetical protein